MTDKSESSQPVHHRTQTREWLEQISTPESREKGGYHRAHLAGLHITNQQPLCDLCTGNEAYSVNPNRRN